MRARFFLASLVCTAATALALPAGAESGEGPEARAAAQPFAGTPITTPELRGTTGAGLAEHGAAWQRSGDDVAVILWDEAVPPRTQTPAPPPGRQTEVRQGGGRFLMTTVSVPR